MARKQITLDGGVLNVATELLKDKETRDDIREGTKAVVKGGVSLVKGTFIILGSLAGLGILIWGVKKIVHTVQENKKENERQERIKEQKAEAESYLKHEKVWFDNAVAQLKTAMQTSKGFNSWGTEYEEERIITVLKDLKNKHEWIYLLDEFGKIDGHNLLDWLGCDGQSDIASYNKILEDLSIDEIYKITSVSVFAGVDELVIL